MSYKVLYNGCDVSFAQDLIDMVALKASGAQFVMIRAGFGDDATQIDSCFETNIKNALAVGLHVGCYWFSYATSVADAIKEAQAMKLIITKYSGQMDFPMAFDYEGASIAYFEKINGRAPSKQEIEDMTNAFLGEMTKGCWYAVITAISILSKITMQTLPGVIAFGWLIIIRVTQHSHAVCAKLKVMAVNQVLVPTLIWISLT